MLFWDWEDHTHFQLFDSKNISLGKAQALGKTSKSDDDGAFEYKNFIKHSDDEEDIVDHYIQRLGDGVPKKSQMSSCHICYQSAVLPINVCQPAVLPKICLFVNKYSSRAGIAR